MNDFTYIDCVMDFVPLLCKVGRGFSCYSDKGKSNQQHARDSSKVLGFGEVSCLLSNLDDMVTHSKVEYFAHMLKSCVSTKDLETGRRVHFIILENEPQPNLILNNALINMYCKCGSVLDAHKIFSVMIEKDVYTWTTMIAGYAILGPPENALNLFSNMERHNIHPDKITFLSIFKVCAKLKMLEHGRQVHVSLKKSGVNENILIQSSLVDMYAKCGSIDCACRAFNEISERDAVSWNAMISGYAQSGCFDDVLLCFIQMMNEDLKPDKVTFTNVLKACANLHLVNHGMWAHDYLVKQKLEADTHIGSTLVDMYAKCGSSSDAWVVFNMMPRKSEVSWNAMIIGYAQPGCAEKSLSLFWKMELANVAHTEVSYVGAFKACAVLGSLRDARSVHESFKKSGLKENLILKNGLIDMYAKCGDVEEAHRVFDDIQQRDLVSWNALILGYAVHGPANAAIKLYQTMQKEGFQPDRVTFLSVLKACMNLPTLEQGIEVHSHVKQTSLKFDIFVVSTLIDMYAKWGSIEEARRLFDEMRNKNEVAWNSMIAGYVQHGHLDEAFKLFDQMDQSNVKPVKVTYLSMIKACSNLGDVEKSRLMHSLIVFSGYEGDKFIGNSLVDLYSKYGDVHDAQHIFDAVEEKNLVSWNALISGFVQQGQIESAFELFEEMLSTNIEQNEVTFLTALKACASDALYLSHGTCIHSCVVQYSYDVLPYVRNSLIDMYSKCGSIEDARNVFDFSSKEELVTWNVMITGYMFLGMAEEAFKFSRQMTSVGMQPDEVTLLSLLKASGDLGSLKFGKEVHAVIERFGLHSNAIRNAIIDMYSKCGSLDDAYVVFRQLSQRELVSWNAIISGHLQHGLMQEVLDLFQEMKEECQVPDTITILNVSKACGILGYLDAAEQTHKFAEVSGLQFDLFLNNTLIDTYGKCGDVKAARKIFDGMQVHDSVSWNALLTGYAQHGNVKEAFECFHRMQFEQELDQVTFITVLSVCNYAGLIDEGCYYFESLHYVYGIEHTQEHCACIVDMLCRAGRMMEAGEFIKKMPLQPGTIVWMALLSNCRLNSSFFLAITATKFIFEIQPEHTAPYVLLSNISTLPGDWEGTDILELLAKTTNIVTG
ncbi:hypothetical protein KP509_02G042200 [Ceratopteris richardii]|nr:hypothetical protein KP509_02G042200 [Ceratopteris richardii]